VSRIVVRKERRREGRRGRAGRGWMRMEMKRREGRREGEK